MTAIRIITYYSYYSQRQPQTEPCIGLAQSICLTNLSHQLQQYLQRGPVSTVLASPSWPLSGNISIFSACPAVSCIQRA